MHRVLQVRLLEAEVSDIQQRLVEREAEVDGLTLELAEVGRQLARYSSACSRFQSHAGDVFRHGVALQIPSDRLLAIATGCSTSCSGARTGSGWG